MRKRLAKTWPTRGSASGAASTTSCKTVGTPSVGHTSASVTCSQIGQYRAWGIFRFPLEAA